MNLELLKLSIPCLEHLDTPPTISILFNHAATTRPPPQLKRGQLVHCMADKHVVGKFEGQIMCKRQR